MQYIASVFGMKLHSDKPFVGRDFHDLHQTVIRINSGSNHSGFFKILQVSVVEFITVTVSFADFFTPYALYDFVPSFSTQG